MLASEGRAVVVVNENSIVMGFDTPVTSDEREGEVSKFGLGVRVRVPEAIEKLFLLIWRVTSLGEESIKFWI